MRNALVLIALTLVLVSFQSPRAQQQMTTTGGTRPTVSRDGAWVAYQAPGSQIMKMPSSGGVPEFLATGVEPNWERPGDLVVYRSGGIYTVDATTLATALVYAGGGIDDGPAWSPLGNEIAMESSSNSIAIISYPGGVYSTVPCTAPDLTSCQGEGPTWSPDGTEIAFEDGVDLLKVARTGGAAVNLLTWSDLTQPAWSPDGKWIALAMSHPAPVDSLTQAQSHIWIVDARGQSFGLTQITSGQVADFEPAWTPDASTIYFASDRSGVREIWRIAVPALATKKMTFGGVKALYRSK